MHHLQHRLYRRQDRGPVRFHRLRLNQVMVLHLGHLLLQVNVAEGIRDSQACSRPSLVGMIVVVWERPSGAEEQGRVDHQISRPKLQRHQPQVLIRILLLQMVGLICLPIGQTIHLNIDTRHTRLSKSRTRNNVRLKDEEDPIQMFLARREGRLDTLQAEPTVLNENVIAIVIEREVTKPI